MNHSAISHSYQCMLLTAVAFIPAIADDTSPRSTLLFTYIHGPSRYEEYFADKLRAVPPDVLKQPGKAYPSGNTNEKRVYNGQ